MGLSSKVPATFGSVAPVLVLGIGDPLQADEDIGLALLELLRPEFADDPRVELVDGGTQGMLLVGLLEKRRALLVLDAMRCGGRPGQVHMTRTADHTFAQRGFGAPGANAAELLASARRLHVLPEEVVLVGIEPKEIRTRLGLSPVVRRALPAAHALARSQLRGLRARLTARVPACTN